jgi:E3 SUMO-protein ligase PIAS1
MVEADGEWHTTDDKYGSVGWKASHPPPTAVPAPGRLNSPVNKVPLASQSSSNPKRDANSSEPEIVVLDSDDEDEGWVKRELSPSFGGSSSISANQSFDGTTVSRSHVQRNNIIDLTLDSDDDEQPRRPEKRKAAEAVVSPTEQIWKKGRQDNQPVPAIPEQVPPTHSSPILNGSAFNYSHRSQSSQNMPNRIVSARVPYSASPFGGGGSHSYPQYAPLPPRPAPVVGSSLPPLGRSSYVNSRWPDS